MNSRLKVMSNARVKEMLFNWGSIFVRSNPAHSGTLWCWSRRFSLSTTKFLFFMTRYSKPPVNSARTMRIALIFKASPGIMENMMKASSPVVAIMAVVSAAKLKIL